MAELFPHQVEGIEWLSKRRFGYLADHMGLGKSVQTIKSANKVGAKKILIVCMAIGRCNWVTEFEKWDEEKLPIRPIESLSDHPPLFFESGVFTVSYDYISKNYEALNLIEWDLVVFDEAHMLKSFESKRTLAALGKKGLIRNTKRAWFLSGTPSPNHIGEMWPFLYTFGGTKLGYDAFVRRFCVSTQTAFGFQIRGTRMKLLPEIKSLLKPFMLRRELEKGMLPDLFYQHVSIEAADIEKEIETSFPNFFVPINKKDELMKRLAHEESLVANMLSIISFGNNNKQLEMQQEKSLDAMGTSLSALRRYHGLQKMGPCAKLIDWELNNNAYEKIVIFAIHRDVIEGLRVLLKDHHPVTLYGGMPDRKKIRNIKKFQETNKYRVIICNIIAAGTTINLTRANEVAFVEQDWVPGNNAQAAMRVHRIGQTKPVRVRMFGVYGSIDSKITSILRKKTQELSKIFESDVVKSHKPKKAYPEFTSFKADKTEEIQVPDPFK